MKGETMRATMAVPLTALLLMAAMALAADSQVFQGSGDFGVSFFESTDASGCVITDVSVSAGTGTIHVVPGGPTTANGLSVFIGQFDTCRQLQLMGALGGTSNLSFQFARDLSSVRATGTMLIADAVSGTSFVISVDMSWTGFGDSQRNAGSAIS
jgi:hypothetical protein